MTSDRYEEKARGTVKSWHSKLYPMSTLNIFEDEEYLFLINLFAQALREEAARQREIDARIAENNCEGECRDNNGKSLIAKMIREAGEERK